MQRAADVSVSTLAGLEEDQVARALEWVQQRSAWEEEVTQWCSAAIDDEDRADKAMRLVYVAESHINSVVEHFRKVRLRPRAPFVTRRRSPLPRRSLECRRPRAARDCVPGGRHNGRV